MSKQTKDAPKGKPKVKAADKAKARDLAKANLNVPTVETPTKPTDKAKDPSAKAPAKPKRESKK